MKYHHSFRPLGRHADCATSRRAAVSRWHPLGLPMIAAAILLSTFGCSGRVYRASRLPPELIAPPIVDTQTINLSGLTEHSVSTDVIQAGDLLDVTMITDYSKLTTTTTPVRVGDDGSITVPLVGQLTVAGLEVEQAERMLNNESIARGVFRKPCITLSMKQCRTRRVTVVGAVNKPGTHLLPRGSTSLMSALLAAEGLSPEAGTEVEIRHTDSRVAQQAAVQASYQQGAVPQQQPSNVTKVNLQEAVAGLTPVPELTDGDVVHVVKRTLPPVYVIGLVQKPGSYPYPPNQEVRVLDAVALAGGISNPVAEEILVIRRPEGKPEPVRIAVSLQAAKNGQDNMVLCPGDTVSIEQTPATAAVGVIQTFIRFSIGGSVSWF